MISIITGDIVASRSKQVTTWLQLLEDVLSVYGGNPQQWEVFRGDSFQVEVPPQEAFKAVLHIKAKVRTVDNLDVRMGIGIGARDYQSEKITMSNGAAFIHSGECFDSLQKRTLGVKSPWPDFDEEMNLLFDLASLTMNHWTRISADTILHLLADSKMNQAALANKLNKSQSNISGALNRGGFKEIMNLEKYFRKKVLLHYNY